jgi:hypothetical protein
MDNNKLLIGFVVVLVGFLAFPVVAKKMQQSKSAPAPGAAPAASAGGALPAPPAQKYPELEQPPLLNESNLTGTTWALESSGYRMKVTLAPGGVLYLTHPMAKALTGLDYIEGRWRVEYNKVFVDATAGGNSVSRELRIGGNKLYSLIGKGEPKAVEPF